MMRPAHRGSALLVVLGMMAFMVVSAVAFSAYMRYSRAPSSFLRQSLSSRLLVKAALAEAISVIDEAVANNPHPNIGNQAFDGGGDGHNKWVGRVYTGCTNDSEIVSCDDTITPLCLEALAYIPPPLVNEARYYSRLSHAAEWQYMNFDAGRYVFCALDVSDYFDINAVRANTARSSEPDSKVSLAYLFEDEEHKSPDAGAFGKASDWDDFLENKLPEKGTLSGLPLVSLADWNLAMHNVNPFGDKKKNPPFCSFIGGTAANGFYGTTTKSDLDLFRQMTFVTDSYAPPKAAASGDAYLDLADDNNQPWEFETLEKWENNRLQTVLSGDGSEFVKRLNNHVPRVISAALYDYLDKDRIPLSLALPTVERTPMICGVEIEYSGKLKVNREVCKYEPEKPDASLEKCTRTKTIQYNLDGGELLKQLTVNALVVYPFRHKDGLSFGNYKIDGTVLLFLTSSDDKMVFRPSKAVDRLAAIYSNGDFYGYSKKSATVENGVIVVPIPPSEVSAIESDLKSEKEAVQVVTLGMPDFSTLAEKLKEKENALLYAKLSHEQHATPKDEGTYDWSNPHTVKNDEIETATDSEVIAEECNFKPLNKDGESDPGFSKDLMKTFRGTGKNLELNVAVVLRVLDENDRVVDMVPATLDCDSAFLKTERAQGPDAEEISRISGGGTPLLKFGTAAKFTWSKTGFDGGSDGKGGICNTAVDVTISPKSALVTDPRFNYAPECWFAFSENLGGNEQKWVDSCGAHSADGDIFMQVSDQCRLQSIYELANLPRIGQVSSADGKVRMNPGDDAICGMLQEFSDITAFAESSAKVQNKEYMWKTYNPFGQNGDDGFADWHVVSSGNGFGICPYSDNTNVLMAVFANTPHDWRCASVYNKEITDRTTSFNKNHAWNEYSAGAQLKWADLEDVAGAFVEDVRMNPAGNGEEEPWEVAFRNLGWKTGSGAEECILDGLQIDKNDKVFNSDKKFLYGFWHDSFSSRQQLFLIFVRAEPVMMGGGIIGQTPPQLGARAVALVWRDPAKTSANNRPHRTRILFYHQFD